jgi:hypothetical protein
LNCFSLPEEFPARFPRFRPIGNIQLAVEECNPAQEISIERNSIDAVGTTFDSYPPN